MGRKLRTVGLVEARDGNAEVLATRLAARGLASLRVADVAMLTDLAATNRLALAIVAVEDDVATAGLAALAGRLPVLALVPRGAPRLAVAALAAGAAAAVLKPVDLDQLLRLSDLLIGERRAVRRDGGLARSVQALAAAADRRAIAPNPLN